MQLQQLTQLVANPPFRQYQIHLSIQTWRDFEQQFQLHFFLVNTEADVINTLEETSYHQGGQTVNDYLDNFQTLVSNVGYTDPQTLVVKFR